MPRGPKGEKRPADAVGAAIKVAKIATGEIEEDNHNDTNVAFAREAGLKGGKARAASLSADERKKIARAGAAARWQRKRDGVE